MEMDDERSLLERLDAAALVAAQGTPLWVLDETLLRHRCRTLSGIGERIGLDFHYACKANASPALLRTVLDEGLGLDAVSIGELLLARRMGFPVERISYTGSKVDAEEIAAVVGQGVELIADSLAQVGTIAALSERPKSIALRLNLGKGAGHHGHVVTSGPRSKFGLSRDEIAEARFLCDRAGIEITGLHQHVGSGILDVEVFIERMMELLEEARAFPRLELIDFGGGIGIPYRPDADPFKFGVFEKRLKPVFEKIRAARPGRRMRFRMQPGRYVAAECGLLLLRVTTVERRRYESFVGVDGGMNQLIRPALYDSWHEIRNLSRPDAPIEQFTVVGPICESADRLAVDRRLARPEVGDILAVLDCGAYGRMMSSSYNLRPPGPEVFIRESGDVEVVRARLGIEEWLRREGFIAPGE